MNKDVFGIDSIELLDRVAELEQLLEEKEEQIQKLNQNYVRGFEKVQKLANVGYWYLANGDLYWSDNHYELLGYKRNEVTPSHELFLSHIHPQDRDLVKNTKDKAIANKSDLKVEFRFITVDKRERWGLTQAEVILDNKGLFFGFDGVFQDITELKTIKRILSNNEKQIERIFEFSPNAITLTDLKGNIIDCNSATAAIHGYEKSELIGKNITTLIIKKQKLLAIQSALKTMKDGSTRNVEYTLLKKDGTEFPASISTSIVRDEFRKPVYFVGITRDLTEQKQAEQALKASEEKYRKVVENNNTPIIVLDEQGKILFVNNALALYLGDKPDVITGRYYYEFVDAQQAETVKDRIEIVLKSGENKSYEKKVETPTGDKWFLSVYQPILKKGKHAEIQILSYDITKQKQTEIALKVSNKRFRMLFENASDAIFVSDNKGNLVDVNIQACKSLGYTHEELITKTIMDIDKNISNEQLLNEIWKAATVGESNIIQSIHLTKDGNEIPVEINVGFIDYNGNNYFFGVARDKTQQQKAEEILKESEERYRVLANATMEAVFISEKGICVDTNDTACKMFGYKHKEIIGIFGTDVIAPESKDFVKSNMLSGFEKPYEAMAIRKDGTVFPALFHGRMYKYKGTNIRLTTCRDLTEQREYERKIEKNQKRLERAEEIARIGHWEFHLDSNQVIASNGAYIVYGLDAIKDNMTVAAVQTFPLPEYREMLDKAMSDLITQNKPYDIEFKIMRPTDNKIIDIRSVAQYDKQKNAVFGVLYDITEQKRAEVAIRQSETRFKAIFDHAPIGIVVSDPETITQRVLTNNAFQAFVGLDSEMMDANSLKACSHPDDYEKDMELFAQVLNGDIEFYQLEKRYIHKNGDLKWGNLYFSRIRGENNEPFLYLAMIKDITKRKLNEELLKRSLDEKEILLKEIHHRVKNNMQIIISLLNMQAKKLKHDPNVQKAFMESRQRIYSMALVHEKLYQSDDFSQIDFKEYIDFLLEQLISSFKTNKDIQYHVAIQESLLSIELAIPCGLIVNELLTNVLKHAFTNTEKGNVWIEVKLIKNGNMLLRVADDGKGLPDNFQSKFKGSLGHELVNALTRQLEGTLTINHTAGAEFLVEFSPQLDNK